VRPAGIGAAGDDAEVGARLLKRVRIDVGLGGRLGVILLNAQMSGFGDGNLGSTRALPVLDPNRSTLLMEVNSATLVYTVPEFIAYTKA
jgi:hypothetical protein